MTLLGGVPPAKWRESTRMQAQLRLADFANQLHDLEHLRQAMPDTDSAKDALLVKLLDAERGEISRVVRLSSSQRQIAARDPQDAITLSLAYNEENAIP